ncbi:coiled-coil domain-containing protein 63 [Patella vulgata]|uniref:coiled-coil domain-containing protein 63 n=1 Tax=Patella vulgata TaxID=6465 RepID=UPI0024A96A0A|nr:coiled-coil domain-containing protein 63 [Patella vulgata]
MVRQPQTDIDGDSGDEEVNEMAVQEAALLADKSRLIHQIRVMEHDKRAYAEETERILKRQRIQIKALQKENREISTVLRLTESERNSNWDENNTMMLQELVEKEDCYKQQKDEEREKIRKLDEEIRKIEKEIRVERKPVDSVPSEMMIQKRTTVLENRLDQSTVKFNEQLAVNAELRLEIDHSRREKGMFEIFYNKLNTELQQLRKGSSEFIQEASQAYEQRDEAHNIMVALKDRNEKDQFQHEVEMKELQRIIDHDNKLKEFMMIKSSDRADFKEEEEAKKNKNKRDGDIGAVVAQIESFEEAFEQIKKITGQDDINTITKEFLTKENENFAFFNFVNELNNEVDNLQEEIINIKQEICRFEEDDFKMQTDRKDFYEEFKFQAKCAKEEMEETEERIDECVDIVEKLTDGVESLFNCLKCDRSAINEMLACEDGVTENNILLYMGIIEQRTMDLLHIQHYIDMKKAEPEKDGRNKDKEPVEIKTERPKPISIKAPTLGYTFVSLFSEIMKIR